MTASYENVQRSLQNLKESDISEENFQAVRDYIDRTAAEGVGTSQQVRIISSMKLLLTKFAPDGFELRGASEKELKQVVAALNRSDYAENGAKHKCRASLKKFYKQENGGKHPDKVGFFSVHANNKPTSVTREDLFTKDELKALFQGFSNLRDRALTMVMYESGARPGEARGMKIGDFISNGKGDFVFLEGLKYTPDRTNQLVRAGRTVREWIAAHPFGGELGDIEDPSKPMWVKTEQHACKKCGDVPQFHEDDCSYEADLTDHLKADAYLRRFKKACERAEIPENKRRPYNLRHTRLTEVAKFMGYEQLNKFAGWKPGSDRAKVYVHLNNDDVNQAIRDKYGLETEDEDDQLQSCQFCGTENESQHSECRNCGRILSLKDKEKVQEKQQVLERLAELEENGLLDKISQLTLDGDDSQADEILV